MHLHAANNRQGILLLANESPNKPIYRVFMNVYYVDRQ